MDIHRCRFVPFQPQTINALSFSHESDANRSTPKSVRLALGRDNGDIEIWNPLQGEWVQERIFRGSIGRTVEQVHWTQEAILPEEETSRVQVEEGALRLFSSGGSSSITEWDIQTGTPKRHAESNSADIWCFAPQPQWNESQVRGNRSQVSAATSQLLAAGCADGSIVLFSTAEDELRFDRILTRPHGRRSRCICITWRDRNTVVAGFEESVIRIFDIRNKQLTRTLTLGKARDTAKPLVWTVKCLSDGTILSGDSGGELKIWDRQYFSLVQRLKTHNADILDIATNAAGTIILSCGVDRRTVAYALQSRSHSLGSQILREIRHRRFHEHDVKALASYESKDLSIAVSGGIDTIPVVIPLRNWDEDYHRLLPHLPQRPQMSVSGESRLLLTWAAQDLSIWHIPSKITKSTDANFPPNEQLGHKILAQIKLKGNEHITSAEISTNGALIAVATAASVRLFQIRRVVSTAGRMEIRSRNIELPKNIAGQGASIVAFSPNSSWLCAARLNNVLSMLKIFSTASSTASSTVDIAIHEKIVKLDRRRRKIVLDQQTVPAHYGRHISAVAFSSDSKLLAVGDLSGNIDTWTLESHEEDIQTKAHIERNSGSRSESDGDSSASESDSEDESNTFMVQGQKWTRTAAGSQLPGLGSAILAVAFRPKSARSQTIEPQESENMKSVARLADDAHDEGMLIAVTADHQVVEFDVMNCRLSGWSRRNPRSMLPEQFRKIKDRVMGIWIDHRASKRIYRLWLYGPSFIYMLNMNCDLISPSGPRSMVKVGKLGKHVLEAPHGHALALSKDFENNSRKRRKRNNFGAGDEMRAEQKYSSNAKVLHFSTKGGMNDADVEMLSPPKTDDEVSIRNFDQEPKSTAPPQRDISSPARTAQRQKTIDDIGLEDIGNDELSLSSWHTFQYRAILGIKTLSEQSFDEEAAPEIVIVERPMYDVDLSPRFADGQDW